MALPILQTALSAGEISPQIWGRTDLDKYRRGCSTLRNMAVSYRGGAFSRPGTALVGICKQPGTSDPPHLIPFQFSVAQGIILEFGDNYIRFAINGAYVTETPIAITGITQAGPGVVSVTNSWSNGDEVYLTGIGGMTSLNNQIYIVAGRTSGSITLLNALTGVPISTAALPSYTSGGTAARIYTLATPYAASDLPSLKWSQSADVMTLTHPSYPPYDLSRITDSDWQLTETTFATSIVAPATCAGTSSTSGTVYYQYGATAVDSTTGEESVLSPIATFTSDDIAIVSGSITINCAPVTGAGSYNFYKAPESYGTPPVGGGLFGYVGTSLGLSFRDNNIIPDYSTVPPTHNNPFATSSALEVKMTAFGTAYSSTQTTVAISSSTGGGFVGIPIVIGGGIEWVAEISGGGGYTSGDKVVFTDASMSGSGASASFVLGPSTGTFPSVTAYFQERRFYANTNNNPDTYFASQPGAFTNMDSADPPADSDAIIGTPWAQQVNGVQAMINMPGGLVILTGLGAWQLSGGAGATGAAITPSDQVAVAQAYNGCSPIIRPIVINYDILYVQEKGSIVRDLSYNFFVNIYTGTDMTVLSNHLFDGYTIMRWDWAEEPFKLVWAVRNDGTLLCLTYLKEQDVYAWSRHDTNGLYQSVACISEPPVNAPYFIVKRLIQNDGAPVWAYFLERMDDREWNDIFDAWCVDCGLTYEPNYPNATLSFSSAMGVQTLNQPTLIYGGSNYSNSTYARILDPTGSDANANIVITGGVITAASVSGILTGYTNPTFQVVDPTMAGGGAAINITINNVATVTASPGVFSDAPSNGEPGDIIRYGNGMATVTAYNSSTSLTVNITNPMTSVMTDDPNNTVIPAASGQWWISSPITVVEGLGHLEGMQVSVLADGEPQAPLTVANGQITLPEPAAVVTVGLGYTCQMQTLYMDTPVQPTIQGRRKVIYNAVMRVQDTGGPFSIGTDQPDASTQPENQNVAWKNLSPVNPPFGNTNPVQPQALYTGDIFQDVMASLGYDTGQFAVQMTQPLPITILSLVLWAEIQDPPS